MKNLPSEFIDSLKALNHSAYDRLPDVIAESDPAVSVRINPAGKHTESLFEGMEPVAWNKNGFYLPSRPDFTLDPAFHQGAYYVQEAASMAVAAAVERALPEIEPRGVVRYLDACAAPGGKTTAVADVLPPDAFIAANEYDPRRASVLTENLHKWGIDAYITRADASSLPFPDEFFDIITADVPCSGEGMMRKDYFAIEQWTPGLVAECAALQRSIVSNLWRMLRPGGVIIYSTCTFNLSENERNIEFVINELGGVPLEIPSLARFTVSARGGCDFPAYRFVPGFTKSEGLFLAAVQKPMTEGTSYSRDSKFKIKKPNCPPEFAPSKFLTDDFTLVDDNPLRAVRTSHLNIYRTLSQFARPISAGIEYGAIKGRDFIPSQQLALSRFLKPGAFPTFEVDLPMALSYLKREPLRLPPDVPRGIILLTYLQNPLGWVKNIGSRANNLYPEQWRIRKSLETPRK